MRIGWPSGNRLGILPRRSRLRVVRGMALLTLLPAVVQRMSGACIQLGCRARKRLKSGLGGQGLFCGYIVAPCRDSTLQTQDPMVMAS